MVRETYSSVSLFDCNKPSSTNFARRTSSIALSNFRSVALRSVRAVSRSRCIFLPRLTDSSARRTGCDYSTRFCQHRPSPSQLPTIMEPRKKKRDRRAAYNVRKQNAENAEAKKRQLTCSFRFCGSEAIHPPTQELTFSTSMSKTPPPDTMATICKYSAIAEGDKARVISSRPVIVVSTCSFFIFSFL